MNLPKPSYSTSQSGDLLPIFTSSLAFDGKTYVGNPGKNKKEAEQKAARTVIQSILGTPSPRTVLTEIIKSKSRHFAAIHEINAWSSSYSTGVYGSPPANKSLASHSNVSPSAHLSMVPVTSGLKKPNEELVYDSLVGLAGNERVALNLSSGPSQPTRDPETGTSAIHADHYSVLNEGNAGTACISSQSVDATRLSKQKRKRYNQKLAEA